MTEMLKLETTSIIEMTYAQLDEIVSSFYGHTYSSINSDAEISNDTYMKYSTNDYYDLARELDEHASDIQKWKDSDSAPLTGVDEFLRIRDEMFFPNWTVMLTFLINEGRIPEANYLISFEW